MIASRSLGCIIVCALTATAASAEDWTFSSRLLQRFQADTDRELDDNTSNNDGGPVFESATRAEASVLVRSKRSAWSLDTGIGASFFAGEGADGSDKFEHSLPRAALGYSYQGKISSVALSAEYSIQETSFSQFEDTGIGNQDTTETRIDAEAKYETQLNELNSLEFTASGSSVDFSDSSTDLEPNRNVDLETAFVRQLNRRTKGAIVIGAGAYWADNEEDTESLYGSLAGRVDRSVSKRMDLRVSAGASLINTEENTNGGPVREEETAVGFSGQAELKYRWSPDLETRLRASQSLEPSSLGEVQNRTTVEFTLGQQIDEVSRFDFRTAYTFSESASDNDSDSSRQTFIISPSYQMGLAPQWAMRVGYDFRMSEEDSETESSHGVFLEVSRDFDIFP